MLGVLLEVFEVGCVDVVIVWFECCVVVMLWVFDWDEELMFVVLFVVYWFV